MKGFILPDTSFIEAEDHAAWLRANMAFALKPNADNDAYIIDLLLRSGWVRLLNGFLYHLASTSPNALHNAQAHFAAHGGTQERCTVWVSYPNGHAVSFWAAANNDWEWLLKEARRQVA